jgi:hypothetical protein
MQNFFLERLKEELRWPFTGPGSGYCMETCLAVYPRFEYRYANHLYHLVLVWQPIRCNNRKGFFNYPRAGGLCQPLHSHCRHPYILELGTRLYQECELNQVVRHLISE